jgi:hypothetical protein
MFGAIRSEVGMTKMFFPVVGNFANAVDFVVDLRHIGQALRGKTNRSLLKSSADALFHGLGMVIPQVGGIYDMVQGGVRSTAPIFNARNYWGWGPWGGMVWW